MRRALAQLTAAALVALAGCGSTRAPSPRPAHAAPSGPPVEFSFESIDERDVSSAALRGRATVIAFVTTYAAPSTIQARYLKKVAADHVPRINAALVFYEQAENRPLVRIFRDALGLSLPIAMADAESIAGRGAFKGLDTVPSVVVLDPSGREVWRKVGVADATELQRALRDAQAGVWGPRP
ncbi:MAG: TlpA family protein disulfide reductase [Polyangiaceae bacterium]|nr:TlpA family protein disulfide reductase [Polyangiaceae bacterium]